MIWFVLLISISLAGNMLYYIFYAAIWVIVPSEHSKNRDEEEEVEARLNWFPELKFYSRRSLLSIERFMHMFFRGGLGTRVIYSCYCCCCSKEEQNER